MHVLAALPGLEMSTEVQEVEGRKRSRSGSCSSDGEASKRKRLPSAGMEEEAKAEGEEDERVAILDAGAQYGKVNVLLYLELVVWP